MAYYPNHTRGKIHPHVAHGRVLMPGSPADSGSVTWLSHPTIERTILIPAYEDHAGFRAAYPPLPSCYPPFAYFNPASYPVAPQYPMKHPYTGVAAQPFAAARPLKSEPKTPAHKAINIKGSYRDWRHRPFLNRYDSDDSGIAESPKSMTSSVTWTSLDESSSDECKLLERKTKPSSTDEEVFENNCREAKAETEKERNTLLDANSYWSISNDDHYWQDLRQKAPSNYVINKIVDQVEYYLSDEYLVKDKYLLRQVRCKKDGYVSIKLITSFKKVKKLTKDWAVVRSAIVRKSNKILVCSDGLRIKRKHELSATLKKPRQLTSVLVIRLPEGFNAVDRVTSLFSSFGEIGYVRLLRPDKSVPADLKNYATQVPDIGKSLCAVVDFETADDALNAVRVIKLIQKPEDEEGKEADTKAIEKLTSILKDLPPLDDTRLALLGPRVRRTLYRQDRVPDDPDDKSVKDHDHETQNLEVPVISHDDRESRSRNDPTTRNPSPTCSKSPRPRRISRRFLFSVSEASTNYAIRQPRCPEEGKGFERERSAKR